MEDKAIIKAKKIQCYIGLLFLVPAVLGVLAFVLQVFNVDFEISGVSYLTGLDHLSRKWTVDYSYGEGGGGMSAAPIYMALMGLAGAYLIKDNLHYFFLEDKPQANK